MITAKIIDQNFIHHKSMGFNPSRYVRWERRGSTDDTVFFTDNCLPAIFDLDCRRKIAVLLEPPELHPTTYAFVKAHIERFDAVLTYDRDLLGFDKKCLFMPGNSTWIGNDDVKMHNKTKLVSIVASSKSSTPCQAMRQEVIARFGDEMDVYGKGRNEIKNKADGLRDYMFSVAIENSVSDDYFTEKILDCFATGTIPIYYGTGRIRLYFEREGILCFSNLMELERILNLIDEELYYKMSLSAAKNLWITQKYYYSLEDYIYTKYPFLFE